MRLVWKTVWYDLYARRRNFILVLLVSIIALYLLAEVLFIADQSRHEIYTVKKMMDKKMDYVHFEIIDDMNKDDYMDMVQDFIEALRQRYPDCYGYFLDYDVGFQEYYREDAYGGRQKVVYVSSVLWDLFPLKDISGRTIPLDEQNVQDGLLHVYVGYGLRDDLPVGTVITDADTGTKMYVDNVLERGSRWMSISLFGGEGADRPLDDCIFSPLDDCMQRDALLNVNGWDAQYVICNDESEAQEVMQNIKNLAREYGVMLYCHTICGWIDGEVLQSWEIMRTSGALMIFAVIIVVFAIGAASVADVYSRQYEFGIMYIHGVSPLQIFMSIFLENMIKLLIAGGIAMYFSGSRFSGTQAYVYKTMTIPQLWIFILSIGLIVTLISYSEVRRHSMTDFVGGAYR